ncbi:MAG: glutaminase [Propionibacterium sp.]|nr:glutaminase [Propionibacterium sp.]
MRSIVSDYLADAIHDVDVNRAGALAGYIPELANADAERLAAVFATVDGTVYGAGNVDTPFTIQSISKPFVYALALADRGFHAVLAKVGVEPSGEAFNEISLEPGTGRPRNPMINAGAITTHALAGSPGVRAAARTQRVIDGLSAFAGRRLSVDEAVCTSEMAHAHRNLAIAHMLRSHDILTEDPREVVDGYIRQCAVLVTTRDLAMMAATLANHGLNPRSGERVVEESVIRHVLSVMATCGMYDAAGDWATQVGIPAKSGVAGGLIGALPGQVGIATFSPRLDEHGNSVRGLQLFEQFSADMGLHVMSVPPAARSVVRSHHVVGDGTNAIRVLQLQGGIRFAGAEKIVREVEVAAPTEHTVALDLTLVSSIDNVAQRMLRELTRRLDEGGHRMILVDPESLFPSPLPADAGAVDVVASLTGASAP